MGMSCSVMSSTAPTLRWRAAAKADIRPDHTGTASLASVQREAAAMQPAPMKRTWCFQTDRAKAAASPGVAGARAVRIGVSTPQAMTRPMPMAMPTEMPTRCPAPSRANCRLKPRPVAPAPARKYFAASPANRRVATSMA